MMRHDGKVTLPVLRSSPDLGPGFGKMIHRLAEKPLFFPIFRRIVPAYDQGTPHHVCIQGFRLCAAPWAASS
jgi:hypothetical protein